MVDALPIQRKQGPKWRPNKCTFIATCSLSRASPSGRRASTKLHPALECHGAWAASFGTFCSGVPRAKPPKGTWRPAKKRKTTAGASCWTQAIVKKIKPSRSGLPMPSQGAYGPKSTGQLKVLGLTQTCQANQQQNQDILRTEDPKGCQRERCQGCAGRPPRLGISWPILGHSTCALWPLYHIPQQETRTCRKDSRLTAWFGAG